MQLSATRTTFTGQSLADAADQEWGFLVQETGYELLYEDGAAIALEAFLRWGSLAQETGYQLLTEDGMSIALEAYVSTTP